MTGRTFSRLDRRLYIEASSERPHRHQGTPMKSGVIVVDVGLLFVELLEVKATPHRRGQLALYHIDRQVPEPYSMRAILDTEAKRLPCALPYFLYSDTMIILFDNKLLFSLSRKTESTSTLRLTRILGAR